MSTFSTWKNQNSIFKKFLEESWVIIAICHIFFEDISSNFVFSKCFFYVLIFYLSGNRWRLFFIVISSIYMILVTLLYYSFSIEMIFNITTFIMQQCGYNNFASKSTATFSEFSIQYTTLFTIPIFLGLLFLRDLKFMIKIAELGVYAIYSYVVFIFYCFISNITSGAL